jgi:hypothetical protein
MGRPRKVIEEVKPANPIFEAFEAYALALQNYNEAVAVISEAMAVLTMAREGLARFGIYISNEPPADKTFPVYENPYVDEEDLEVEDEGEQDLYAPARGPAFNRTPSETEVEKIRSASYPVGGDNKVAADDADALAAAAGDTMGLLMRSLTKGGGKMTVGPQVVGQPLGGPDNPHEKNQHGGPVEQRPV